MGNIYWRKIFILDDDLSPTEIHQDYRFGDTVLGSNITYLMKLVLCIKKFPEGILLIKTILKDCPEEINKRNIYGRSALLLACEYCSNYETIKLLLDAGANMDHDIYPALSMACMFSSTEIIKLLISAGADINFKNRLGDSALSYLCRHNEDRTDAIELLINAGINLTTVDVYGRTYLMDICDNSNSTIKAISLLIDTSIDAQDKNGFTALMYFMRRNIIEDIDFLMYFVGKSKASLHLLNKENQTSYDIYQSSNIDILDEYQLNILKGECLVNNTKSAKKIGTQSTIL